ncbi:MAG TPA: hemerythrin domain-containing protein [Anaerolineaceae bacterium]|nr:hemerythrin domain-containing protein [Anaerolineaceae bacterium]
MSALPTEILEDEHRLIIRVVNALSIFAQNMEEGWDVEEETFNDLIQFMRVFAEKWHPAKEEDVLFPQLIARGVPATGCPLAQLVSEHKKSNNFVSEIVKALELYRKGDKAARESVIQGLRNLSSYYINHIWNEDNMLFPMANKVFSEEDQQKMLEGFDRIDALRGQKLHDRLEEFALKLEEQF